MQEHGHKSIGRGIALDDRRNTQCNNPERAQQNQRDGDRMLEIHSDRL
jgi:hypothetical protein